MSEKKKTDLRLIIMVRMKRARETALARVSIRVIWTVPKKWIKSNLAKKATRFMRREQKSKGRQKKTKLTSRSRPGRSRPHRQRGQRCHERRCQKYDKNDQKKRKDVAILFYERWEKRWEEKAAATTTRQSITKQSNRELVSRNKLFLLASLTRRCCSPGSPGLRGGGPSGVRAKRGSALPDRCRG